MLKPPRHAAPEHALETSWIPVRASPLIGSSTRFWIALGFVWGLAVVVRAVHALPTDFPLNDGGLFYVMINDLRQAGYALPRVTSYNQEAIPFAYSPLAFYLAGLMADALHVDVLALLRLLPFSISCLTAVAFFLLARTILTSQSAVLASTFAFATMPRSFTWTIMGGGLTRSLGFLFAILTLWQVCVLYKTRSIRAIVLGAIFAALTAASHLGTVPMLIYSIALLWLWSGRHRAGFLGSIVLGVGAVVLSAPWWLTVLQMHGVEPFLAAQATGGSVFSDPLARRGLLGLLAHLGVGNWHWSSTGESLFPLLGTLGLLGAFASLVRRQWLLATWWLAILVLDTRAGSTYATLPVAMLVGVAIERVLLPLLQSESRGQWPASPGWTRNWAAVLSLGFLALYCTLSATVRVKGAQNDLSALVSLSREERGAMQWVSMHTPSDSRFLVLPEDPWGGWEGDKSSEWFPALAQRTSIATVQGSEWLPRGEFSRRRDSAKQLRKCGTSVPRCLDEWIDRHGQRMTHVYIPHRPVPPDEAYLLCCQLLIGSLPDDPRYELIYSEPGAYIYKRR